MNDKAPLDLRAGYTLQFVKESNWWLLCLNGKPICTRSTKAEARRERRAHFRARKLKDLTDRKQECL